MRWFTNGACVVMAGGFAVPKEPATDKFAARFNEAGFTVLAFDYRGLGESGGEPRLVLPVRDQIADWHAAIDFARTLPGVDPTRIAAWAFSASAGHVLRAAAHNPLLAAAILQTPLIGGLKATRGPAGHQKPLAMLRFVARGLSDTIGGLLRRPPLLVSLSGEPGTVAMLNTPDALDGDRALEADRYPSFQRAVAARSALRLTLYQPGRDAPRVRCPLLVLVCEQDQSTLTDVTMRVMHCPGR